MGVNEEQIVRRKEIHLDLKTGRIKSKRDF